LTFKIKTIRQLRRQREADEFSSVPLPSCHCIALTVFLVYFKHSGINAGFSPLHPPPLQKADTLEFFSYVIKQQKGYEFVSRGLFHFWEHFI